MSRQSLLDTYFKTSKVNVSPLPKSIMNSDDDKVVKKRSLSLKKAVTPSKSPKLGTGHSASAVIDLCSDDDQVSSCSSQSSVLGVKTPTKVKSFSTPPRSSKTTPTTPKTVTPVYSGKTDCDKTEYDSDSSQATVIYSPPSPVTPQRTQPQTPRRTSQTPTSSFKSPSTGKKYYSPIKKRAVPLKKPVRRNLAHNLTDCIENNDLFNKACLGLDDKTIFLLRTINKCFCNPSLYKLLDEDAQSLLSRAMHVAKPGMRLVCRLYWYKEGWYKLDKVRSLLTGDGDNMIDDPTLHEVLNSLQDCGFLTLGGSEGNSISFDEFTTLLSAPELKQICKEMKLKINSKQDAIAALQGCCRAKSIDHYFSANTSDNSMRILKIMSSKAGPCYKLSDLARKTIYKLNILMYLGIDYNIIREKNLEMTLLFDKTNRETYPVGEEMLDDASVVFREKEEFERFVQAHDIREEYLIETDSTKKSEIVASTYIKFGNVSDNEISYVKSLPVWLRRFTSYYMYIKVLEAGVQDLKKEKRFGLALNILDALLAQDLCRQHARAEWFAEKSLVLHKCGRPAEAAQVLLEGFKSNLSEEAKDTLRPRAKMFAKQKNLDLDQEVRAELLEHAAKDDILEKNLRGVHIYKQPMDRSVQKGKLKFETRTSGERVIQDVEEYCISHYISSGEFTDGMHWEGKIVTTIFFLLFWDIIYWRPPKCAGIFLTRFQKYPLDMFCESFYENRREAIEACLELIESCTTEKVLEIMEARWQERPETSVCGASGLGAGAWARLRGAARALGARALAALCRRLAAHYRHARAGFPDLTLWNEHTGKIRFVEVKSDTDKPSMKQIQWMHYLRRHGIDAEFCYVGVHTTRCKARPVS